MTQILFDKSIALLIVDLQNDFLPPEGALAVPDGDKIISVIQRLLPQYKTIIATKDWHPQDHVSFNTSHKKVQVGDQITINGVSQIIWPRHCVQDTEGAELAQDLKDQLEVLKINSNKNIFIIEKGTTSTIDSYSGFFDNHRLYKTNLDALLKTQNITSLHVCGLATDYCVKYTVLDALELGFKVELIIDACRAVKLKPKDEEGAINKMLSHGASIRKI